MVISMHSIVKCQMGMMKAIVLTSRSDFHSTEPQFNVKHLVISVTLGSLGLCSFNISKMHNGNPAWHLG